MSYFVVELDELDEPVSVLGEVELRGGGGVGLVGSFGRVLGEAEGATRSLSVTRSLLSVQPASTPAPSASTQKPVSNLFIVVPPSWIGSAEHGCNGGAADARLEVRWAPGGRWQAPAFTP